MAGGGASRAAAAETAIAKVVDPALHSQLRLVLNLLDTRVGGLLIGGRLALSMQVLEWLEPYLSTSAFANSNAANRPAIPSASSSAIECPSTLLVQTASR